MRFPRPLQTPTGSPSIPPAPPQPEPVFRPKVPATRSPTPAPARSYAPTLPPAPSATCPTRGNRTLLVHPSVLEIVPPATPSRPIAPRRLACHTYVQNFQSILDRAMAPAEHPVRTPRSVPDRKSSALHS